MYIWEGKFILRFRLRFRKDKGDEIIQCSLWEADGGMWKGEAMNNIKAWLEQASPDIKTIA